jgi:hypothetical protein
MIKCCKKNNSQLKKELGIKLFTCWIVYLRKPNFSIKAL